MFVYKRHNIDSGYTQFNNHAYIRKELKTTVALYLLGFFPHNFKASVLVIVQ